MAKPLGKTIALVTGASRGAGRGIALALGELGATVYVTGRSTRTGTITQGRQETIEGTAGRVNTRGGKGIAIRCDHADDGQVQLLFARIMDEQGRLDVVVNNAWGGYERDMEMKPFWKLSIDHWDHMVTAGLRSQLVTARSAASLLMLSERGLLVNTTSPIKAKYHGNLYYDVVKTSSARMTMAMAEDFRASGVAAIALAPGWMRTERVLGVYKTDAENWTKVKELEETESPEYAGRAIAALAQDAKVMEKTGKLFEVGELARLYDFTDIDGRKVPPFSEFHPELF